MLRVAGRRAVVVGGGEVAARRARALAEVEAAVTVVAPTVSGAIVELQERGMVEVERRGFEERDCRGAFIVVAATGDPSVNERVAAAAREAGALVNRADAPEEGDLVVPAHRRVGPITVAVATGGASAAAAATLVNGCIASIDEAWVAVLEAAGEFRPRVQARFAKGEARRRALRAMTDGAAFEAYRRGGEAGLRDHLERILDHAE